MKNLFLLLITAFCFVCLKAQNVGIATTTPTEKLDVNGNLRLSGEIKPAGAAGLPGQVLTSNGNGTMQWSSSTGSTGEGNGGWGDCSIYNIQDYQPVGNANASLGDNFGYAVAISGEYAIVGSPYDDDFIGDGGSATIYKYNSVTSGWESQGKVYNPNASGGDGFGSSVSISGNYAIVGAYNDNENNMGGTGSATIFKRNTTTGVWESQGKMINGAAAAGDYFGFDVSIYGDYAMIGTPYDDENTVTNCGSVTIYKRNTTTGVWESQGKYINTGPVISDAFGISVAISDNYAIVGANLDDEIGMTDMGSATTFKRNTSTGVWSPQAKLFEDGFNNDNFGSSVAIDGDYIIVGVPGDMNNQGAAAIYKRNTSTDIWEPQIRITNGDPQPGDRFGTQVSITSQFAAVGSLADDEQQENERGSATIFKKLSEGLWACHQKFTTPIPGSYSKFGTIALTSSGNRFVAGSNNSLGGRGVAYFGSIIE